LGLVGLRADESRVQAAGKRDVSCSLNDGAAVWEEGESVLSAPEAEQQVVAQDVTVRTETVLHFGEIDGAGALMDLDGVAATERDVRAALAAQMGKISLGADRAPR
jgi:hypothetical protein